MVSAMSNRRLKSTREAAAVLGVTPRTVARWVAAGRLTAEAQGPGPTGALLFTEEQIAAAAHDCAEDGHGWPCTVVAAARAARAEATR